MLAGLAAVLVTIAALAWWRQAGGGKTAKKALQTVPTLAVAPGRIERTLRITGVTAAEKYVSLIAPMLRGSRSGRGRGGRSGGGGSSSSSSSAASESTVQSTAGSSRSSSSSTPALETGSSGGSSGGGSLSGVSTTSSAFRAATSRSSSRSGSSRSSSSSSSSAAAIGAADFGSTAFGLPGGGGGGGGGSMGGGGGPGGDFALVLQELIKPGSFVKKGDVVAEFDRQYMLNRLDDYRDSVVQSEASHRRRLAELDVTRKARLQNIASAKGDVDRARLDLKTLPVRSAIESERYRLALEEAEARYRQVADEMKLVDISEKATLRIAEIELQQAKIELQRAEANMNRMIIKAPIEGLTVMQQTFRGAEFGTIQQGDQVSSGQPFMRIVDLRSMVIEAVVNQTDVEALRIGQEARVRFDAYPDLELPARIFSIGAMTKAGGFRGSFIKEVPVRLKLEKLDPRVIPDLTVSADVILESSADQQAVIVPLQGVFRDSRQSQPYVFARTPSGWERRPVVLGLTNYVSAAVVSGLRKGDVIALERPPAPGSAAAGPAGGAGGRQ